MTRTAERETFYADIVCTAAEGGIEGWGYAENRRMHNELIQHGGLSPQRHGGDNYTFTLVDQSDGEEPKRYSVTPTTIARAYVLIRKQSVTNEQLGLASSYREAIRAAYYEQDAGEIDGFFADWLVQIGLWGEVRYS